MASDLFRRSKSPPGRGRPAPAAGVADKPSKAFHAVTIVPGPHACIAALGQLGQRFLAHEAPRLPLKGCGNGSCECRYEHHTDRRQGRRRTGGLSVPTKGPDGSEQRTESPHGRRRSD